MTYDDRETQELLRRASRAIGNLRSVAARKSRYNKATADDALATLKAINDALDYPLDRKCFVVVDRCEGAIAKCRCGWEGHYGHRFSARDAAVEHETNQP